jgi:hypothetical protein
MKRRLRPPFHVVGRRTRGTLAGRVTSSAAKTAYGRTALLTVAIASLPLLAAFGYVLRDELPRFHYQYLFMGGRSLILLAVALAAVIALRLAVRARTTFRAVLAVCLLVSIAAPIVAWSASFRTPYRAWLADALDAPSRALDLIFWPAYRQPYIGHWFGEDQWFAWIFQSLFPVYASLTLLTAAAFFAGARLLAHARKRRVLASIFLLFWSRVVLACSCATLAPKFAFQEADEVFVATATVVTPSDETELTIEKRFKVSSPETKRRVRRMSMCDATFQPGKRYLVFTYREEGEVRASMCSRTKPIEQAACDLRLLERRAKWWATWVARVTKTWHNPFIPPRLPCTA